MEEDVVHCPRCTSRMILSPGESSVRKEKFRCPNHNCGAEYQRITATGHLVEASVVLGAVTAVGGFILAGLGWYFGGSR